MYLLGITGKKHSGKDTVCDIIKELLAPRTIARISFGDFIKEEVAKICGVTVDEINMHKEVFRPMLQWWGEEFRRKYCNDEQYWIRKWARKINDLSDQTYCVITTDVRMLLEAKIIKDCGGIIVRVQREPQYNPTLVDTHVTETEMDQIKHDHYILNNGSLADLRQFVTTTLVNIQKHTLNGNEYDSSDRTKAGALHTARMQNVS